MNNKYSHNTDHLDTYDAEIIEDIPEQFDLNRYKKASQLKASSQDTQYRSVQSSSSSSSSQQQPTQYIHATSMFPNHHNVMHESYTGVREHDYSNFKQVIPSHPYNDYSYSKKNAKSQLDSNSQQQLYATSAQPYYQYVNPVTGVVPTPTPPPPPPPPASNYPYSSSNSNYATNPVQTPTQTQRYVSQDYINTTTSSSTPSSTQANSTQYVNGYETVSSKKKTSKYDYDYDTSQKITTSSSRYQTSPTSTSNPPWTTRARSDERKKSSYEDEENESTSYEKKEYFLKGGDDVPREKKWLLNRENVDDTVKKQPLTKSDAYSRSDSGSVHFSQSNETKSNIKPAIKKHGVTFDEKLEVYEVKNPHYGLEVKSEKRELKKKKKDRQKEEETFVKTKLDMKAKIQNQNMVLYNFYEKTLVYNALVYYEENYYRSSIRRLQEKVKNNKTDEKLKEHCIQIIEKENQTTLDIIRSVKRDYYTKLEPFCNQYQTSVEKLHTLPGMYPIMQQTANSVQYNEIVKAYVNKEQNSPSTFRKILGHESRSSEKHFFTNHQIRPPAQRKSDLWLPKHVLAAIDMHVREICYTNFKTITDFIYKLNEVCENDLHRTRAIYKYMLMTSLEGLRRNDTGVLMMTNYENSIESTNTIFARLCSFAGIENHCIRGLWKTIMSEPGEKIESKCLWNALYIENGWRFIQPSNTPVKYYNKSEIKIEETEYYFLSDPDTLIYEFLPHDKIWQLTDSLISVKEFEKRPILTPFFRQFNLTIVPLTTNISPNLDKEPFKLTIRYPKELSESINFKYILKPINFSLNYQIPSNSLNVNLSHIEHLNLYVIAEMISKENAIIFKISSLPQVGSYSFTIYAGLTDEYSSSESSFDPLNNSDLKAVACIRINCPKAAQFDTPPNKITPNEITVFGMNNIMRRLGLNCHDYKQGILGTDREGKVNLVFEMSQPLDVEAYLFCSDTSINPKYLELCILKRVVHNFLIIIINPPHAGLYGLDLRGISKGSYQTMHHAELPPIGKYLIKCNTQVRSFIQFPKGDNRDWGPKQKFYDLGLLTRSYIDPYILNEDGKQIEIEIGVLNPVTMWFNFSHYQNGSPKDINNFCFMNYKSLNKQGHKTVSFLLRFPFRGFYHLALMATNENVVKPDEIVYNYLIRVQDPPSEVEAFPVVVNPILWRDCCLIAPKNLRLNSYDVHFSIIVPKTSQVLVSSVDQIIEKLESREIENSWVGLVSLNESLNSKYIFIEAEFNHKYTKLVRFRGLGNAVTNNEQLYE